MRVGATSFGRVPSMVDGALLRFGLADGVLALPGLGGLVPLRSALLLLGLLLLVALLLITGSGRPIA